MNFKDQLKVTSDQHLQNLMKIQEKFKQLENFKIENYEITVGAGQETSSGLENGNYAGVYVIFAAEPSRTQFIVSNLEDYRESPTREHCVPAPSRTFGDDNVPLSGCLYVGKSLTSLNSRLKNHLSCPKNKNKTTFALKMNLWAKEPELLKVFLIKIDVNDELDKVLISECEEALRNFFRPAIGE